MSCQLVGGMNQPSQLVMSDKVYRASQQGQTVHIAMFVQCPKDVADKKGETLVMARTTLEHAEHEDYETTLKQAEHEDYETRASRA